ncbi:NAD(P) transhydrogenase subunit alpha [Kibdelosporangium philippinense]|uniref:proton-translocating NAD(P)(+) transhydrogenase n=1 Tax=Kibdelosporangium philippinense TaxID=211113 RepID=A0ABS8ZW74_9PSEU|nr:NAD(P) transhydrogenase subunit alpha [Kibdelosporangium philippinense]MCE7011872.1 NAD(P) transhydrogenase subunit alpha [Kibdelosporangium philippinense]
MADTQNIVVGVPRESAPGERRVALVPKVVGRLRSAGLNIVVEPGAGGGALMSDWLYEEAGATLGDPWACDVVVKVAAPTDEEIGRLKPGSVLIGFLGTNPQENRLADALINRDVHGMAMEAIPRISRAQSMDALSSQSSVAGYLAALLGAQHLTRFYPMLTTAAGTVPPAKTLVLGAGVAGLQALATARRLGAQTTGYDVRPEVAEQVRSVGSRWLDLGIEAVGEGGYARALSEEERAEQLKRLNEAVIGYDVVITTAQVPGRKAPVLVTEDSVTAMRAGSVVVDLAGETGGNCELSVPGEVVVRHDVTIVAPLNLPASMPESASELYSRNIQALLELLITDGRLMLDFDDEIVAAACVTRRS